MAVWPCLSVLSPTPSQCCPVPTACVFCERGYDLMGESLSPSTAQMLPSMLELFRCLYSKNSFLHVHVHAPQEMACGYTQWQQTKANGPKTEVGKGSDQGLGYEEFAFLVPIQKLTSSNQRYTGQNIDAATVDLPFCSSAIKRLSPGEESAIRKVVQRTGVTLI